MPVDRGHNIWHGACLCYISGKIRLRKVLSLFHAFVDTKNSAVGSPETSVENAIQDAVEAGVDMRYED